MFVQRIFTLPICKKNPRTAAERQDQKGQPDAWAIQNFELKASIVWSCSFEHQYHRRVCTNVSSCRFHSGLRHECYNYCGNPRIQHTPHKQLFISRAFGS